MSKTQIRLTEICSTAAEHRFKSTNARAQRKKTFQVHALHVHGIGLSSSSLVSSSPANPTADVEPPSARVDADEVHTPVRGGALTALAAPGGFEEDGRGLMTRTLGRKRNGSSSIGTCTHSQSRQSVSRDGRCMSETGALPALPASFASTIAIACLA